MKNVEAGERSWLLGPTKQPTIDYSDECSIIGTLSKIALVGLLFIGTFIGVYLIHQQLIANALAKKDTILITDNFDLVHRDVWHADEAIPRGQPLNQSLVHRVVVFHTRGPQCQQFRWCVKLMQEMQIASNMSTGADIPFNFLIGGDGQTYEARGWSHQSAVDEVPANTTLTIAFIGDFSTMPPAEAQLRQAETLLGEAVQRGHLIANYRAYGVRYLAEAHDNGSALFAALALRWPQWDVLINVM